MKNMDTALNKITNILNNFLEPFDCIAEPGKDFAYYSQKNLITYALVTPEKDTISFMNFTTKLYPNIKADPFLWSTMHELGHNQTEDDFEDDDTEYWDQVAQAKTDEDYYNIPQEYAATDWAGEYMEEHFEEIGRLWQKLAPAINDFYRVMGVE